MELYIFSFLVAILAFLDPELNPLIKMLAGPDPQYCYRLLYTFCGTMKWVN
jgi:hypothetical protein